MRGVYFSQASYQGVLNGNRLIGIWKNGESNGQIEFEFDMAKNKFKGTWGYGTAPMKYWQTGTRSKPSE